MKFPISLISLLLLAGAIKAQNAAPAQVLPRYGETLASNQRRWFDIPADLKARAIWNLTTEQGNSEAQRFFWADLNNGKISEGAQHSPRRFFRSWQFSPDGAHVLGQFLTGDNANQHDARVWEWQSHRFVAVADKIYFDSERWSPDGKSIAFFRGTTDTTVGNERPVTLRVWDVATQRERMLRKDDTMRNLRWTAPDDLRVDSYARRASDEENGMATTIEFKGARPPRRIVKDATVAISPDRSRAFWEIIPDGQRIRIVRADGSAFRVMKEPTSGQLRWSHDGKDLWVIEQFSPDGPLIGADGWPNVAVRTLKLRLWRINASNGKTEIVSEISAQQNGTEASLIPDGQLSPSLLAFETLGFSSDERYFFVRRTEWKNENVMLIPQATGLFALRISDGKLLPVGAFKGVATLAPR